MNVSEAIEQLRCIEALGHGNAELLDIHDRPLEGFKPVVTLSDEVSYCLNHSLMEKKERKIKYLNKGD